MAGVKLALTSGEDLSPYDWLLARRTAALGVALGALVFIVMVGTDEGLATLGGRLGRLAAFVSLAGGGAAFIATEQARSRGELRALGAAGVPPVKASLGAIVGGAGVGALGPVLALARGVDLSPLFPRASPFGGTWTPQGDTWLEAARGIVVRASGELEMVGAMDLARALPDPVPRATTATAFALAAIGFPLWATARGSSVHRAAVVLAVALASVAVFHLVAAGRMPPAALVLPPSCVLLDSWILHRRVSWS
jgi:hypothetical protein